MKRLSLKINRNLKTMLVVAGILGASALHTAAAHDKTKLERALVNNTIALVPFVGVAAGLKKNGKWEALDDNTKAYIEQQDEVLKQMHEAKEALEARVKAMEDAGEELSAEDVEALKSMEETIKKHATEIEKFKNTTSGGGASQTFLQTITKALEENKVKLEEAATKRDGGFQISFKANNSTLTTDYSSSAPNSYLPVPQFMPGVHTSPEIAVTIMDVIDMGTSNSPVITWVNEQPIEGDAGWTAENALKSQVAWKYTNETSTAKKVTAFIKVTTQALRNIPWLASRINTRLRDLIRRKIQDGIINGDGTNDEVLGIIPQVPGYITNSFDNSVDTPTTADAIMAMAGQIDELERETSNLIAVMNGVDLRKMNWEKDKNGNYLMPNFLTPSGKYIDNMLVVKNNKITKGYALVGDLKLFSALMVEDVMLDIGLDGNDFTYNRRTIICEAELITMLSDNDKGSFCYAEIAAVKAEIDKAV